MEFSSSVLNAVLLCVRKCRQQKYQWEEEVLIQSTAKLVVNPNLKIRQINPENDMLQVGSITSMLPLTVLALPVILNAQIMPKIAKFSSLLHATDIK